MRYNDQKVVHDPQRPFPALVPGTLGFRFYFNFFFFFFVLFRRTRRLKVSGGSRGRTSAAGHRQVLPRRFD